MQCVRGVLPHNTIGTTKLVPPAILGEWFYSIGKRQLMSWNQWNDNNKIQVNNTFRLIISEIEFIIINILGSR